MNTIPDFVADKLLGGLWSVQLEFDPGSIQISRTEGIARLAACSYTQTIDFCDSHPLGIFFKHSQSVFGFGYGFRYGPKHLECTSIP